MREAIRRVPGGKPLLARGGELPDMPWGGK